MYYLGSPSHAFQVMRQEAIGFTNANLNKMPLGLKVLFGNDADKDGLPDVFEQAVGTAKDKIDTDGDGFSDFRELSTGYSPLEKNKKLIFDNVLTLKFKGRILLQIQGKGQAWYVYPMDQKRYFLSRPTDAFNVMRQLSLGITDKDYQALGGK
ncbi:hypothetical protein A3H09_03725 [Candidatus Falkowbacteria bacterium RIFCSPLOWO2_12_FULL_45_13]|uniref:Uncharacterized protein n=1 Tax=Candidatus Falkowbacteria bacterium RIFCSPLOWO2_12_FULL_45_13 TaxID=1797991 RepID=A0A1F5SVX2_9BACT|nr:MAG: hypothetical protein A3H09_03725 [Candidatus Falkowbacteria bacterium RIFCSPLOWO2_12_FULL_45_13]